MGFEAIIVGSGMSGGWAAKEFCEAGLKTLLLERGRHVEHGEDYVGENRDPWDMKFRDKVERSFADRHHPIQQKCYAFNESTRNFFVDDNEYPYSQEDGKEFNWIRGSQLGGRSLLWHRQSYRFSEMDFESNKRDGHGVDWPIRYKDLEKWYDYVEEFVGVSGTNENLPQLPDGKFLPPIGLNCAEQEIKKRIEENFNDRVLIPGRCAHLTEPQPIHTELGRGTCQSRDQCQRGCSLGAYFSSQSATLPAANLTGNLTTITDAIVHSVIYDPESKRATGVRVIDTNTKQTTEYYAQVIFLCASTISTTQILLNSASDYFPRGFGNASGVLGKYLMDHLNQAGARGEFDGLLDSYYVGRKPNTCYMPRFQNLETNDRDYLRGYAFLGGARRFDWKSRLNDKGFGADFKESFKMPGHWRVSFEGKGEMLPYEHNRVTLHPTKKDQWGMPQVHINCAYGLNELRMRDAMRKDAIEMLSKIGVKNIRGYIADAAPGIDNHEMGTARMGHDPRSSFLNANNQSHEVDNVFITDGSCMASSACQNPSLTYMALTARAVDYSITQMKANVF